MAKKGWLITGLLAVAVAGGGWATQERWLPLVWPQGANAQSQNRPPPARVVPVETAVVVRKDVPLKFEALGTVQPVAAVAIKSRLETEITGVHFKDGAPVKEGDLLFTLDSRTIEAQIAQQEGVLARDQAQLEGAERDIKRFAELVAKNAGTRVNLENAQTQAQMLRGSVQATESVIRNLRVQLSYTKIHAPISGRISAAAVKAGNFVRPADVAPLATIVQTRPVYVAFGVPQRTLPDVRQAIQQGTSRVEAFGPGEIEPSTGRIAMIDNTVDATSGMLMVRALMDNEGEVLWPGTLVNVALILRNEMSVIVPSVAIQVGQAGSFVFVVKDGAAEVRPVKVARTYAGESIIAEGLAGGETVVTDGQLLLANGTKVQTRQRRAGA